MCTGNIVILLLSHRLKICIVLAQRPCWTESQPQLVYLKILKN